MNFKLMINDFEIKTVLTVDYSSFEKLMTVTINPLLPDYKLYTYLKIDAPTTLAVIYGKRVVKCTGYVTSFSVNNENIEINLYISDKYPKNYRNEAYTDKERNLIMHNKKLLPCPFCGNEVEFTSAQWDHSFGETLCTVPLIKCNHCNAWFDFEEWDTSYSEFEKTGDIDKINKEYIEKFNKRVHVC